MRAHIPRSAVIAALAAPIIVLSTATAFADQPVASNADQPTVQIVEQSLRRNADSFYIHVTICVHIPTPGSATLDWCWP